MHQKKARQRRWRPTTNKEREEKTRIGNKRFFKSQVWYLNVNLNYVAPKGGCPNLQENSETMSFTLELAKMSYKYTRIQT